MTLETEIKKFADSRSYWEKYIAAKILVDDAISDNDIDVAYSYLLEELTLEDTTDKPEIIITYSGNNSGDYKPDLLFTKLENVEGVNALSENQEIDFCTNLTIIYGVNASGKSGYVRLMKKAFYSKSPEDILPNIYIEKGHKPVGAKFTFLSNNTNIPIIYPENSGQAEFEQFSVFDGKSVLQYLEQKNEFEFRPASLNFFSDFIEAIKRVEVKLNKEISEKQSYYRIIDFLGLFDGESEIKTSIQNLSSQTKIEDLKKYTPFSEGDKADKIIIENKCDELLLSSKNKEKEIQSLENIKILVSDNKKTIESINTYFTAERLSQIKMAITDCVDKEAIAKAEGIEKFKTDKINSVGTNEWKYFIVAAEQFAKKQKYGGTTYPENNDNCLLCQQSLSDDAQILIKNYWAFVKSIAEQEANQAQKALTELKICFENLNFNLFPTENTLTIYLKEKYPEVLDSLKQKLAEQKTLSANIVSDLTTKTSYKRTEIETSIADHDMIISDIEKAIKQFRENEQSVELEKLLKVKIFLIHKEKFNVFFPKFETYIVNQQWINKAQRLNWMILKRNITEWEKHLSEKYFNKKYIDTFNMECQNLNGNFGIEINHTGSGGTSYRQLSLKGRSPAIILSEGEQKIIALADFLSEMQLSEVNRGVIFDDPVNSLDEYRNKNIAERLVCESRKKQVIVFTHDLIFVSNLITFCEDNKVPFFCHWVEKRGDNPGYVWLQNTPSFEKQYRNSEPAMKCYQEANNIECPPEKREFFVKSGFTALRTCYEVLVINDLFKNVVQRYKERVSVEALSDVYFNEELVNELLDNFNQCCRYMEGHTHSDKYSYEKPEPKNLNEEIIRYNEIRSKIRKTKKLSS